MYDTYFIQYLLIQHSVAITATERESQRVTHVTNNKAPSLQDFHRDPSSSESFSRGTTDQVEQGRDPVRLPVIRRWSSYGKLLHATSPDTVLYRFRNDRISSWCLLQKPARIGQKGWHSRWLDQFNILFYTTLLSSLASELCNLPALSRCSGNLW